MMSPANATSGLLLHEKSLCIFQEIYSNPRFKGSLFRVRNTLRSYAASRFEHDTTRLHHIENSTFRKAGNGELGTQ